MHGYTVTTQVVLDTSFAVTSRGSSLLPAINRRQQIVSAIGCRRQKKKKKCCWPDRLTYKHKLEQNTSGMRVLLIFNHGFNERSRSSAAHQLSGTGVSLLLPINTVIPVSWNMHSTTHILN